MANKIKAQLFAIYLLSLSAEDVPLGQLVNAVKDASDSRYERIEGIRGCLDSGTYQINIELLAEEILGYVGYPIR